jgi:transglutaminase superfamily protein
MTLLRKYRRLAATDRRLLVTSALLLGAFRLGLWLLPFQTVRRLLASMTGATTPLHDIEQPSIERIAWAVAAASQYIPKATCLTQAMATQVLLEWQGHAARLCIGVARGDVGQFQAHAWVECQGRVVIGGTDAPSRFTPLPPLESKGL